MRLHSQMANADTNSYECVDGRQYLLINDQDAHAQGIKDGDLVELHNDRGALLCGAKLSKEVRRGVACLHEGAWMQLDKLIDQQVAAFALPATCRPEGFLAAKEKGTLIYLQPNEERCFSVRTGICQSF